MNFNNPIDWSFIVTLCSIALFIEATLLVHVLFVTQQAFKWYLLFTLPLIVCIWTFYVAWHISDQFEYHSLVPHIHISGIICHQVASPLIVACQIQTALIVLTFMIIILVQNVLLPSTNHPPAWTLARVNPFL
jgi:hypothetical protein